MNEVAHRSEVGAAAFQTVPEPLGDRTGIRTALIGEYAGALRRLRAGTFDVELPRANDVALNQLGQEIGSLAQALERRFDQLSRLAKISADANAGLMLEEILERVYESFRGVIPFDRIGCALIDERSRRVRARWARSEASELLIGPGYSQPLSGSSLEWIVATRRPRLLNDLEEHLEQHPASDATRRIVAEGMRSSLTCPLIVEGRPVGFLFFSSVRPGTYDPSHADAFEEIAGQLSVVVEKSLIYERLLDANRLLQRSQQELEYQAAHDGLTGLPNRTAILDALARTAAEAQRTGAPYGVLMIDVDHFKDINDRHGHQAGDAALRQIGASLASVLRAGEALGRCGGEEFLAVLHARDEKGLAAAGERLRVAVSAEPMALQDTVLAVTVSIGGALARAGSAETWEELVASADAALYAAKAAGRNRVAVRRDVAGQSATASITSGNG
jgi:diguanylate cyclase (GGDEF)-like protein